MWLKLSYSVHLIACTVLLDRGSLKLRFTAFEAHKHTHKHLDESENQITPVDTLFMRIFSSIKAAGQIWSLWSVKTHFDGSDIFNYIGVHHLINCIELHQHQVAQKK